MLIYSEINKNNLFVSLSFFHQIWSQKALEIAKILKIYG